jgi:hypothetical protein
VEAVRSSPAARPVGILFGSLAMFGGPRTKAAYLHGWESC